MNASVLNWIFTPPASTPINAALLNGAKSLLKGIYTFNDGPDYLPTSYTNCNPAQTQYLIHATNKTYVNWPNNSVAWASKPPDADTGAAGTAAAGASGYEGYVANGTPSATAQCWTDCSGFITALMAWVNTEANLPTQFVNWAPSSSIPEAGCFDPQGPCQSPNPVNYFNLTHNTQGFDNIPLANIAPGDLIIYASGSTTTTDTGHIMLVAAVANLTADTIYTLPNGEVINTINTTNPVLVVVIDETQDPHVCDTRGTTPKSQTKTNSQGEAGLGIGLGMGMVLLYESGAVLQFCWGAGAVPMSSTQASATQSANSPGSAVLIGRALAASTAG